MKVSSNRLKSIMLTHRNVNIKADEVVLKYRYRYNEETRNNNWFCNGTVVLSSTMDIADKLSKEHENVEVTWKRQFE